MTLEGCGITSTPFPTASSLLQREILAALYFALPCLARAAKVKEGFLLKIFEFESSVIGREHYLDFLMFTMLYNITISTLNSSIADNLKRLRDKRGYSLEEVIGLSAFSFNIIIEIESGVHQKPPLTCL
jgi:hypothetical protein